MENVVELLSVSLVWATISFTAAMSLLSLINLIIEYSENKIKERKEKALEQQRKNERVEKILKKFEDEKRFKEITFELEKPKTKTNKKAYNFDALKFKK